MTHLLVAMVKPAPRRRGTLNARHAAALLGTSPTTIRLWEERFGYPVPAARVNGQPLYSEEALLALRDALSRELSIVSVIEEVRRTR
jgi:DNA-binding transcriptional MerR regulator